MFLSSPIKPEALFQEDGLQKSNAHAIFFGCSPGQNYWLEEMDVPNPSGKFKQLKMVPDQKEMASEWNRRLGIQPWNNKRNFIRFAPMKDCDIPPGLLAKSVDCFREWIMRTLQGAKLSMKPNDVIVSPSMEKPLSGDPFEVLWAKFSFTEDSWDEQVMWDIRHLLMGSKLGKIPGFPHELEELRGKIFISRDGNSERARKGCGF